MTSPETIAELKAKLASATIGPLTVEYYDGCTGTGIFQPKVVLLSATKTNHAYPGKPGIVAFLFGAPSFEQRDAIERWEMDLMVASRNALPSLLADASRLSAVEQELDRLRALLQRIHDWDHMDTSADGPYWRKEINAALTGSPPAADVLRALGERA